MPKWYHENTGTIFLTIIIGSRFAVGYNTQIWQNAPLSYSLEITPKAFIYDRLHTDYCWHCVGQQLCALTLFRSMPVHGRIAQA